MASWGHPPRLPWHRALKCSDVASKSIHGFCSQHKECLGFVTSFRVTQEENEGSWAALVQLGSPCAADQPWRGEGARRSCRRLEQVRRARSRDPSLSRWPRGNCCLWVCERSEHGACGSSAVRQALKAELAFVWWFEMESGTPRDKSKRFCV